MGYPKNYGLARLEVPLKSTFGWQVRLQRRGVKYAKFFADRSFGCPRQSLKAAMRWRDELLAKLEQKNELRISTRSKRNQSGVVGVSQVSVKGVNGVHYEFWQAAWSPSPGVRKTVRYSVKQHGYRVAFQMAVEARRNAVGD